MAVLAWTVDWERCVEVVDDTETAPVHTIARAEEVDEGWVAVEAVLLRKAFQMQRRPVHLERRLRDEVSNRTRTWMLSAHRPGRRQVEAVVRVADPARVSSIIDRGTELLVQEGAGASTHV